MIRKLFTRLDPVRVAALLAVPVLGVAFWVGVLFLALYFSKH